jgi:hypothetical protein
MDPNAALERLRRLAVGIISKIDGMRNHHGVADVEDEANDMAELFQGLDEWITIKKGFLPQDWKGE